MDYVTVLYTILVAICYSLYFYGCKTTKSEGDPFKGKKLVRTVIIGAIVGIIAVASGNPVTEGFFSETMAAYGFITVLVDKLVVAIYRIVDNRRRYSL